MNFNTEILQLSRRLRNSENRKDKCRKYESSYKHKINIYVIKLFLFTIYRIYRRMQYTFNVLNILSIIIIVKLLKYVKPYL